MRIERGGPVGGYPPTNLPAPPVAVSEEKPIHLETDVVKRIEYCRGLKKDWDSYGAPPIQPKAIDLALDMVGILNGTQHEIIGACPTNDEAILMDTKSGLGIEVSIYGN